MNKFTLLVESLFDGDEISYQKTIAVEDGIITSIEDISNPAAECLSGMLVPGFIDTQVNGGGGVLFNQTPNEDTIQIIGKAHQKFGTTGWLPALITDSLEKMQRAADAVAKARHVNDSGVLGIHFEGPHLSTIKKGVHPENFIRSLSEDEFKIFTRSDLGQVVVTLAPENVMPETISKLVKSGVIVCLGHSNATFEQTNAALEAGATGFTHLFNAMSAFTSREPGMVGAALLSDRYCGLILDGIHVHPSSAKLAYQSHNNIILVTDAMPPVGVEQTSFEFSGQEVTRTNDILTDSEGRLAGSVLNMQSAVNNSIEMLDIKRSDAINLASKNPAKFLGIDNQFGSIRVGYRASMLLLDDSGFVSSSWIEGHKIK